MLEKRVNDMKAIGFGIFIFGFWFIVANLIYWGIFASLGWINIFTIILYFLILGTFLKNLSDKKSNPYWF